MNEEKARELLGDAIKGTNALDSGSVFILWTPISCWGQPMQTVTLDGEFTPEYLEAVAWWIRNKGVK